jgi:hypothetical protein
VHVVKTGDVVNMKNLRFIATPIQHDVEYGSGLKLETPKFTLSYVGNSAPIIDELSQAHLGADILIMDVLKPGNQKHIFALKMQLI